MKLSSTWVRVVAPYLALGALMMPTRGAADEAPPAPQATTETPSDPPFDYAFGRPVTAGEHTYGWYRQTHADEAAKRLGLKATDIADGMDTWHWWVGVDNPGFWRDMAVLTGGHNPTGINIDFFRMLLTVPRAERFKLLGLINDPDCVEATKPDQFGTMLDQMKDGTLTWDPDVFGYSSGVIGLQLFKNRKFDAAKWSLAKYLESPGSVEPPFQIGMACAFCHIGFDPLHPPVNPNEPTWDNLTSTIGDQYMREGLIFGLNVNHHSLAYQYLATQEPGTSETSRFPMDFINNPTVINSIFRLSDRLKERHIEKVTVEQRDMLVSMYKNAGLPLDSPAGSIGGTDQEPTVAVPHILTDGSDSLGVLMASVRVYVNEGMMHKEWYQSWPVNPFNLTDSIARGFAPREFDIINKWRKDPNSPWMQTERRMPNMATFLMAYDSFPLAQAVEAPAPGPEDKRLAGKNYLTTDSEVLKRGKLVFADHCARCHSSKKPDGLAKGGAGAKEAWRKLVLTDDFLDHNYLSDDQRYSVTELGTNAQRAEGHNAQEGWTWGQMSSKTYKLQRARQIDLVDHDAKGKPQPLYNPMTGKNDIHWRGPDSYYRTPTLVGIWATAPFLHNNALGLYNGDPSVAGRIAAYTDAMEKMLTPSKRLGVLSIKVTTEETSLPELFPELKSTVAKLNGLDLRIMAFPKGTPVNLLMNLSAKKLPDLVEAYIKGVLHGEPRTHFANLIDRRRDAGMKALIAEMIKDNSCPDFIEDRGHTYGSSMSDADKKALTEYMKYF